MCREAISPRDMRRFLDFVKTSKAYQKYYNLMFILFNTGLRISELCGLTLDAVGIEHKVIHVRQELMYKSPIGLYIDTTKSVNGYRDVPMLDGVDATSDTEDHHGPCRRYHNG